MKKKERQKQPQARMPEFAFKEFTPEEDKIYEEAVSKYREAMAAGSTLRTAYESHAIADKELAALIQADFLKIMIAERHFGGRQALEDVARDLDVPVALLKETTARMLQEAGMTAASQMGEEFNGVIPKTND